MENVKEWIEIGIVVLSFLAAVLAGFGYYFGSRINAEKKVEEQRLRSKIAQFEYQAATANKKTKELELSIQEQKERAARAETELLVLQSKIKPRSIPIVEKKRLIAELKKFKLEDVMISSSLGDGEAAGYAYQIIEAFNEAGWKVNSGVSNSLYTGTGVYIYYNTENDPMVHRIRRVFENSKIRVKEEIVKSGLRIQIFVASKDNLE